MAAAQASCPACGGPVRFKVGSAMVVVCEYCRSVIARGDRKLEDLGKVAAVVDTGAVLELGLKGKWAGKSFELMGRAQLQHAAGGYWDEWYAYFADGRWGWLAEAQGRYYLTFEQPPTATPKDLPDFDQLEIGQHVRIPSVNVPLVVAEKGEARAVAAQGEIPWRLDPGESYSYADLSAPGGLFGTLDYSSEPPLVFGGQEATLQQLGIPRTNRMREREGKQVQALQVNCPNCGGPMQLRAPDKTERVGCPNCGALLDANKGNLKFLAALEMKIDPLLPLGTTGTLPEGEMTVIGFMVRSVFYENTEYPWEEYLLYDPQLGFRWLVRSERNWSYVTPVSPGDVQVRGQKAYYQGNTYKIFQKGDAGVRYVVGEFYWKVQVGEQAASTDYICPPYMLTKELANFEGASEINYSLGQYLTVDEVETAFKQKGFSRPSKVAPNQPFGFKDVYTTWKWLLLAACLLGALFLVTSSDRKVYEQTFALDRTQAKQTFYTDKTFELSSWRNVYIYVESDVENGWLGIDGDLVNNETQEVQPFIIDVSYYHGVDGGESWSEGGRSSSDYVSAQPTGKYSLRLDTERGGDAAPSMFPSAAGNAPSPGPSRFSIRIEQGVFHWANFIWVVVLLSLPVGVIGIYHFYFETQRWQDSEYNPYSSSDE